jgi:hypothetical protein
MKDLAQHLVWMAAHAFWIGCAFFLVIHCARGAWRLWQRGWRMYLLSERQAERFHSNCAYCQQSGHAHDCPLLTGDRCPACGGPKRSGCLCHACGYCGEIVVLGVAGVVPMDVTWREAAWRESGIHGEPRARVAAANEKQSLQQAVGSKAALRR